MKVIDSFKNLAKQTKNDDPKTENKNHIPVESKIKHLYK